MVSMGAGWFRARAEVRTSWRAIVVVVVLTAVGGGVALTALSGARRTDTSMQRFLAYNHPEDATVFFDVTTQARPERVLRLPQVDATTRLPFLLTSLSRRRWDGFAAFGVANGAGLRDIERPIVVHGRMARVTSPSEIVVNENAARQRHLRPGSRLSVYAYSAAQMLQAGNSGFGSVPPPRGPRFVVHVVGIVRRPDEISVVPIRQDLTYAGSGSMYFTPAFLHRYAGVLGVPFNGLPGQEIVRVRLRHGAADLAAFRRGAVKVMGDHIQILPGADTMVAANAAQRGIKLEVLALLAVGVLAVVATVLVVGELLVREIRDETDDHSKLAAMGMSRRQLFGLGLTRPVIAGSGGALLAG